MQEDVRGCKSRNPDLGCSCGGRDSIHSYSLLSDFV